MRPGPRRTAVRLAAAGVLMLGFGYALVPLYDVLCDLTGLSGAPSNLSRSAAPEAAPAAAAERVVTVQFDAALNRGMPWEVRPERFAMEVRPGITYRTVFHARNRSGRAMTGQAVPSVAPIAAATHLVKQECFCFQSQRLEAGEQLAMPLVFRVSARLPTAVDTLTLSYTFFDITAAARPGAGRPG